MCYELEKNLQTQTYHDQNNWYKWYISTCIIFVDIFASSSTTGMPMTTNMGM